MKDEEMVSSICNESEGITAGTKDGGLPSFLIVNRPIFFYMTPASI